MSGDAPRQKVETFSVRRSLTRRIYGNIDIVSDPGYYHYGLLSRAATHGRCSDILVVSSKK